MYEQESSGDYDGFNYGAPRQHGGSMGTVVPYQEPRPQVDMGNSGCLGALFGGLALMFMSVLDYRKSQLHYDAQRYHADRRLDSVIAQVSGRSRDTEAHLAHGIAPGLTVHDMDRTSLGTSAQAKEPERRPHVAMNGYSNGAGGEWEDIDAEYTYKERDE